MIKIVESPEQILLKATGRRIRKIRQLRNISQEDLAIKIDRSRQIIIEIEYGKNNLSLRTLISISTALKVKVGDWFSLDKDWNDICTKIKEREQQA